MTAYLDAVREISIKTLGVRQQSGVFNKRVNPAEQKRIQPYFDTLKKSFSKKDFCDPDFRKEVKYQLIDRCVSREWAGLVSYVEANLDSLGVMLTIVMDKKFKKFLKDNVNESDMTNLSESKLIKTQRGYQTFVFKNESDVALIILLFSNQIHKQLNLTDRVEEFYKLVDNFFDSAIR